MARLSVEHYRATANMTPDRKSSRFRDFFKSRSSLSLSTVSIVDTSPPDSDSTLPPISTASPTVKHGFEKVGLLPSERSSFLDVQREPENHGGARVAEALKIRGERLRSVDMPHNLGTMLSEAGNLRMNDIAKEATEIQQSPEANVIVDVLKDSLRSYQDSSNDKDLARSRTASLRQLQMEKNTDPSCSSSLIQEIGDDESTDHLGSKDEDTPAAHVLKKLPNSEKDSAPTDPGTAPLGSDGSASYHLNHDLELCEDRNVDKYCKSSSGPSMSDNMFGTPNSGIFAPCSRTFLDDLTDKVHHGGTLNFSELSVSDILDRNDALAQGMRKYVASKVTEALVEHDCQQGGRTDKTVNERLGIVIRVHITAPAAGSKLSSSQVVFHCKNIFASQKTILSFPLRDEKLARMLQTLVLGCYVGATAILILYSPALFVKLLTAVSIFMAIKNVAKADVQSLQLDDNSDSTDLLLVPIDFVLHLLQEKARILIRTTVIAAVNMLVQVLEGVAESVKVDVNIE